MEEKEKKNQKKGGEHKKKNGASIFPLTMKPRTRKKEKEKGIYDHERLLLFALGAVAVAASAAREGVEEEDAATAAGREEGTVSRFRLSIVFLASDGVASVVAVVVAAVLVAAFLVGGVSLDIDSRVPTALLATVPAPVPVNAGAGAEAEAEAGAAFCCGVLRNCALWRVTLSPVLLTPASVEAPARSRAALRKVLPLDDSD